MAGRDLWMMMALATTWASFSCGGTATIEVSGTTLVGVEEEDQALVSIDKAPTVPAGMVLVTTGNLNLRAGPGKEHPILRVMAEGSRVTVGSGVPENSWWYAVRFDGIDGHAHGGYLQPAESAPSTPPAGDARQAAIEKAKAGVGFSYWWGHGRWLASGPSSAVAGSCTGSCPSCSHRGSYGADCSGYVAKIWGVPRENIDLALDSHPYSTWHFDNERHGWQPIARSAVKPADALVYNESGKGHILLVESTTSWGTVWAYEARGCSYGITHNVRSAGSGYKAIARDGF